MCITCVHELEIMDIFPATQFVIRQGHNLTTQKKQTHPYWEPAKFSGWKRPTITVKNIVLDREQIYTKLAWTFGAFSGMDPGTLTWVFVFVFLIRPGGDLAYSKVTPACYVQKRLGQMDQLLSRSHFCDIGLSEISQFNTFIYCWSATEGHSSLI